MAQFQEKIGVSISHFYNTDRLSLKTKRAVSEVFPDINADWLETGEGFMTNTDKLQEEGKFYKIRFFPLLRKVVLQIILSIRYRSMIAK